MPDPLVTVARAIAERDEAAISDLARRQVEAGASALELNIYYIPTDMDQAGTDVEKNYVEILNAAGTPLGGYRVVGDSTDGKHWVSSESCWDWCTHTPTGGYAKVANVKFEPGSFIDGAWNIYLVDGGGTQVSPVVTLPYSTDPSQWYWDFILFKQK